MTEMEEGTTKAFSTFRVLNGDSNIVEREQLFRNMAQLYSYVSDRCDDEQVAQYDEVLCQLAELVESEARAHVAKLLAPLDRAPGNHVTVCDLTPAMLAVGRDRAIDQGRLSGLSWVSGNAEHLPVPDMAFDAYTIAFCLRNVGDRVQGLRDAYRALKPGGRFLCLEFSHVALPPLAKLYDVYSFKLLPWLGARIAGDRDSYQYLVESIRRFPTQDTLAGEMAEVGFRQVKYRNLSGGIAALHSGWRV